MPGPLSPRALTAVILVLIVGAGAWFGYETAFPRPVQSCYAQTLGVEMMTFNNQTYCGETVDAQGPVATPPTQISRGPTTIAVFLGFVFNVTAVSADLVGGLDVAITEPNGTTFHGGLVFGGPLSTNTNWFTPNRESGIYEPSFLENVTLLVEVGA